MFTVKFIHTPHRPKHRQSYDMYHCENYSVIITDGNELVIRLSGVTPVKSGPALWAEFRYTIGCPKTIIEIWDAEHFRCMDRVSTDILKED